MRHEDRFKELGGQERSPTVEEFILWATLGTGTSEEEAKQTIESLIKKGIVTIDENGLVNITDEGKGFANGY